MAHFCEYCGTRLEDGQACSCEMAVASRRPAAPAAAPVRRPAVNSTALLGDLKNVALSYLSSPKKGVRAGVTCKNNMAVMGILVGCNALVAFFYMWAFMGNAVGSAMKGLNSVMSMFGGSSYSVSYPVGKLLLSGILMSAICWCLSALALFGCAKLNKGKLTLVQSLCVASTNTLYHTALLVVGILLGFLSIKLQVLFLIASLIVWAIIGITDLRDYTAMSPTASVKNLGIELGVILLVVLISGFIGYKLVGWCLGDLVSSLGGMFGGLL